MTTSDDAGDVHPDLAAFAPAPIEPHERMTAAAARLVAVAKLPGPLAYPVRHSIAALAGSLETAAEGHRNAPDGLCSQDRPGRPCLAQRIASTLLGEAPTW